MEFQIEEIMILKRLITSGLLSLAAATTSLADPVVLYGPISDDNQHRFGEGIACIDHFSSPSAGADFIVGMPLLPSATDAPGVRLYSGQDGSTVRFSSIGNGIDFGSSVSSLGDANGDSRFDFIVGSYSNSRAFIFLTTANGTSLINIDASVAGILSSEDFGFAVEGMYESLVNNTGPAAAISAPLHFQGSLSFGGVDGAVSFFDSSTGTHLYNCNGSFASNEHFGTALASIADIDNDGKRDLVVGAPDATGNNGKVVVLSGGSAGSCVHIFDIGGPTVSHFGTAVSGVGDINGDGKEDFIAGGPTYTENLQEQGIARLFSGATGTELCTIKGTDLRGNLGGSVRGIGDTNYDGIADFAVGSPGANNDTGKVGIYTFNMQSGQCDLLFTLNGTAANQNFGHKIAGGPKSANTCDMNRDGLPEFIVSTRADSPAPNAGSVLVYTIPTMTPTPTITPTAIPTKTPKPKPTATPKITFPSKAKINFTLGLNGVLTGANLLDKDPQRQCTLTLLARYSKSDLSGVSKTFTIGRLGRSRKLTHFHGSRLPRPLLDPDSKKLYILHLISRNTCNNGRTFYSNVMSRYIPCGTDPTITIDSFMTALSSAIR